MNEIKIELTKKETQALNDGVTVTLVPYKQPEIDPLANLFKGAPVMVGLEDSDREYKGYYSGTGCTFKDCKTPWLTDVFEGWYSMRLPTIEESPRNVWLAHDGSDNCPKGAESLDIMVWNKDEKYPVECIAQGENWNWKIVDRFMIIDKRKK